MKYVNMRAVVLCKECIHRPTSENGDAWGFAVKFPDKKCPCECEDSHYSWMPPDDFYCAHGERKHNDK